MGVDVNAPKHETLQRHCTECTWATDGTIVWCQGCGCGVAASRNLEDGEGDFAPVTVPGAAARNLAFVALAPELARALPAVLDVFRTCVGPAAFAEFAGTSANGSSVHHPQIVAALALLARLPK